MTTLLHAFIQQITIFIFYVIFSPEMVLFTGRDNENLFTHAVANWRHCKVSLYISNTLFASKKYLVLNNTVRGLHIDIICVSEII